MAGLTARVMAMSMAGISSYRILAHTRDGAEALPDPVPSYTYSDLDPGRERSTDPPPILQRQQRSWLNKIVTRFPLLFAAIHDNY
jgi:hypothetical protein